MLELGDKRKENVRLGLPYRSADKFLARPGREQTNVSVRTAWISLCALSCREIFGDKGLNDCHIIRTGVADKSLDRPGRK